MILHILDLMGNMGARYTKPLLMEVYDYLRAMQDDDRLIGIYDNGNLVGYCTFSVCSDITPFYNKDLWTYIRHDPEDGIAYIEKIVTKVWNKEIRNLLEEEITSRYPTVKYGVWHRPGSGDDIKIKVRTRRTHVPS